MNVSFELRRLLKLFFAASHNKSSFDVILVNISTLAYLKDDSAKLLMSLVKPKGKILFSSSKNEELESILVLSGFINVRFEGTSNCKLKCSSRLLFV